MAKAKVTKASKSTGSEVKIGYDPFNGKITKEGLTVHQERKDKKITCKTEAQAIEKFNELVADTQF